MPPKGKRRSNALVTSDAFELLKRVDGENEDIDEARVRPPLKLSRSRAYDLLGRARSAVLRPQNEANKKASETNVKRWYELPSPEPSHAPLPQEETFIAEVATPVVTPPVVLPTPEPEPWEWEHLMSFAEFQKRDPWRQKQLIAAWMENQYLSGKPFVPTLRGGPKNINCFRGCPSYQCSCEDNL